MVQTMRDVALEFNKRYVQAIKNGKNMKNGKVYKAIVQNLFNEYGGVLGHQNSFRTFEADLIQEKKNLKKKEISHVVSVEPKNSNPAQEEFSKSEDNNFNVLPNESSRNFIKDQINLYDLDPENY